MRFFLFFILISNSIYCQNNIEITFKKYLNENYKLDDKASDYVRKSFLNLSKIIDIPTYKLKIVDNNSIFKYDEILETDNFRKLDKAISILAGKQTHYVKIDNKLLYSLSEFENDHYLVQKKLDKYNWELTDEYKSILGFKCRKAKASYQIDDIRGKMTFDYYAWFSVDLPSYFGPSDIVGLPGTILEAGTSSFYYKAVNIKFKQIPDIKLPDNEIITEEKYEDMYKSLLENRFN